MASASVLQIVSGFKPATDGMGDFSRILGSALAYNHSIQSQYLVYRRPSSPLDPGEIAPNTLSYPAEPSPTAFANELASQPTTFTCALLHWGPYAYSRTGQPEAFVQVIEELSKRMPVMVFFHETYAMGYPWQRAFWTTREQRRCVDTLIRIASAALTSNPIYMRRLELRNKAHRELIKIPIFSNIGEPTNPPPVDLRARQLIIFGQLATRNRLYKSHLNEIGKICRQLRVEKIVDVGSGSSRHMPAKLGSAPITTAGWMDEQQLSNLMLDSIAGMIGYWPDVWEKSGVLASYCAHALFPILVELEPRRIPAPAFVPYKLPADISDLATSNGAIPDAQIQSIASAAHTYYVQSQSVEHCAAIIARFALKLTPLNRTQEFS